MSTPRQVPRKVAGRPTGPRTIDGELMDVRAAAALAGTTEKAIRAGVDRRVLPFHRLGGRIVFMKEELMEFYKKLPGCSVTEALANVVQRSGTSD